jgi:response regulator RpfG family c-di-GMP phosphodiesterase
MNAQEKPKILCVDDEARIVEATSLHLRRDYDVHTAGNAAEGLNKLRQIRGISVVVSDMRMPGIDGATFLSQVMHGYPYVSRILLTGDPGRDAAVRAVNKGGIFRYLTKPCRPDELRDAIAAGVIQYRLHHAERAVLQETLLGCIQAMFDVLALTNPVAFGRAHRVKRRATEFAAATDYSDFWQLEAAAMLSQIGYVSLPVELVEKQYYGERLTPEETTLLHGVPDVAIGLLEHIPRLEPVMQILAALNWKDEQVARLGDGTIGLGTRMLGIALEYETLIAQGHSTDVAVQTLRIRRDRYGAELIDKFAAHVGAGVAHDEIREISLRAAQCGMIVLQDVRTHNGTLIVPKGFEVTNAFLGRIGNFGPELLAEKVRVLVPAAQPALRPAVPG